MRNALAEAAKLWMQPHASKAVFSSIHLIDEKTGPSFYKMAGTHTAVKYCPMESTPPAGHFAKVLP